MNKTEKQAKAEKPKKKAANTNSKKKIVDEVTEEITKQKVAVVRVNRRIQKTAKTETESNEIDVEQEAELEQLSKSSPRSKPIDYVSKIN